MTKHATAKDLHIHAGDLLRDVGKGHEVIIHYRGKPFALLKPLHHASGVTSPTHVGDDTLFGIWKSRRDLKDTHGWINKQRAPRYPR